MEIKPKTVSLERIDYSLWTEDVISNARHKIATKCIELEDKFIRDSLISLGWTPPDATCSNCKHYDSHSSNCFQEDISSENSGYICVVKDFGCNRWQEKDK